MLEQALQGARLLYAYTVHVQAPLEETFRYTGEPEYWARDFDGQPIPNLALEWEGPPYKPGSVMVLAPLRKDGTSTPVGSVRMELLHYEKNAEISFRFLTGNHIIYRFVYEQGPGGRTEMTVNALVDGHSPPLNTLRQRLFANRRRKAAVRDHLQVKAQLEARFKT
ncbi:MAG: SRPBCC family protein [Chloroflexia bacterium]